MAERYEYEETTIYSRDFPQRVAYSQYTRTPHAARRADKARNYSYTHIHGLD